MNLRILLAAAALAAAPGFSSAQTPFISRTALFGNPSKIAGRISPDGKWLAWIAPRDGVLNVWVAPVGALDEAKPLTDEHTRPIRQYFWAPDSTQILFLNDKGGDENFLLYSVNVATGAQRALTPFQKTRVQVVGVSEHVRDHILIGLNNRDSRWHDVYRLDLATGTLSPVFMNTQGFGGFVSDDSLTLRIADKPRSDGGDELYKVVDGKAEATPFTVIGPEDARTTGPAGFTADGKTLYWLDSRGRDTAALTAQDMATGKTTVVAADPRSDVGGVLADPQTGRAEAYAVEYLKTDWKPLGASVAGDLDYLRSHLKGQFAVTSQDFANDLWTVADDPVTEPSSTWLYDRKTHALTKLFVSRPELEGAPLSPMTPVEFRTRDGKTETAYLTIPAGTPTDAAGRPSHPLPMVLFVHGGPWARDSYGYSSYHQWLANRGYAVLSVNYRGSTGFGKSFIAAGDHEWAGKMHEDLMDAVAWAVKAGVAEPNKVAIMGGSYGGYATLVGMTYTPTAFACGVDIVGPSNLATLLKSIPPYWEAGRAQLYRAVGDPGTPAGAALLHDRSPLFHAADIRRPLLIGQGANDPRVNHAESDQIVTAMTAKQIPVTYVLFPDEGHGFARPENNIAFNAIAEQFLSGCLGGRSEPIGTALKTSTAQIEHGAEFTPGLKTALASR